MRDSYHVVSTLTITVRRGNHLNRQRTHDARNMRTISNNLLLHDSVGPMGEQDRSGRVNTFRQLSRINRVILLRTNTLVNGTMLTSRTTNSLFTYGTSSLNHVTNLTHNLNGHLSRNINVNTLTQATTRCGSVREGLPPSYHEHTTYFLMTGAGKIGRSPHFDCSRSLRRSSLRA